VRRRRRARNGLFKKLVVAEIFICMWIHARKFWNSTTIKYMAKAETTRPNTASEKERGQTMQPQLQHTI